VNNESSDIIEMLDRDFSAIASADAPDLNPKETHAAQEAANEWIYAGYVPYTTAFIIIC
jgi:glutathionyl-hydroquinone reductase